MVSKINGVFSLVSFKRRLLLRGKCASPNFLIKKKKPKIFAVRDFPVGCGPHGRFSQILPRVYPPRRRISVIRDFPRGCGRRTASQGSMKDATEAIANKTKVDVSTRESNLYQSKLKTQAISHTCSQVIECFGNNMGEETTNNMKDRIVEGKLSGKCGSMNQVQGKVSTDLEFPVHRVTVLALMAAPKCPWRHGKRASRSDITTGTTQIRGKKH